MSNNPLPFLPMTQKEMRQYGFTELDILLISGDAYVDHPAFGIAIIGRLLTAHGYRVGIIAQPNIKNLSDFTVLGRPKLFCGISAGNMDSMVANRSPNGHRRQTDAYSENGQTGLRPDRALIPYCDAIKQVFPKLPIIIGGIEASLRRFVHYDFWQNKIKPSILLDTKADLLVFGMGEKPIIEVCQKIEKGLPLRQIRGTAVLLGAKESAQIEANEGVLLPSFEECQNSMPAFLQATKIIETTINPFSAKMLLQKHQQRYLKVEPPTLPLSSEEMDAIYELPFSKKPHPVYKHEIPAYTMIKDSITVVRGCMGGCSFCALNLHQGKFLSHRSKKSILKEVKALSTTDFFRGTISDLGGPTANAYACLNGLHQACQACTRPSCLFPQICPLFRIDEKKICDLLDSVTALKDVKHVFISSGIRMDLALKTPIYLQKLVEKHVSGHLKVAPEHLSPQVLNRMRKPNAQVFFQFYEEFTKISQKAHKEQYLIPYFIASFPGCTIKDMQEVNRFLRQENWQPQQIQDFIPLPMTAAATMYYTNCDYESTEKIYCAKNRGERQKQRKLLRLK